MIFLKNCNLNNNKEQPKKKLQSIFLFFRIQDSPWHLRNLSVLITTRQLN